MKVLKTLVIIILTIAVTFVWSGCASVIHGRTQPVMFTSTPSGAHVQVGNQSGVTPTSLILNRNEKHVAVFEMDGYQEQNFHLSNGISPWFLLGNLAVGGIPGWIIDAINGSSGELSPQTVHVNLANTVNGGGKMCHLAGERRRNKSVPPLRSPW